MSLVELKSVVKRYGEHTVLQDVDLRIDKGEIIAIIGRSGSGKSTLLRCINGLEPVQGGEVWVDGVAVHDPKANLRECGKCRDRFPELQPVPASRGRAQHHAGPDHRQGRSAGRPRAGARSFRKVGLDEDPGLSRRALSAASKQRVAIAGRSRYNPASCCSTRSRPRSTPELVGEVLLVLEPMARTA
ncbi:MAG: amino acid ABC transporter ATP-binding protein [Betaproteobacteria bacterium]|nr:amino acid ABC transporter ATP-binding protein [Betaproteobacteria bacterium]